MERDELTMLLAHNIQTVMAQRGTNPSQIAKLANLNPTGVYDILSGKSMSPKLDTVRKIANALNVSVHYLLQDRSEVELADELLAIRLFHAHKTSDQPPVSIRTFRHIRQRFAAFSNLSK